jgi:hypothetical protein
VVTPANPGPRIKYGASGTGTGVRYVCAIRCLRMPAFAGMTFVVNPLASVFPAAYRGVSEHKRDVLFFLRIEDSPQLAAESFNFNLLRGKHTWEHMS